MDRACGSRDHFSVWADTKIFVVVGNLLTTSVSAGISNDRQPFHIHKHMIQNQEQH